MRFAKVAKIKDMKDAQGSAIEARAGVKAKDCPGLKWLDSLGDITVDELSAIVARDFGKDQVIQERWFYDLLIDQHQDLDPDFRLVLLERLTPRMALLLMDSAIQLTDAERDMMRDKCRDRATARSDLYARQWARLK